MTKTVDRAGPRRCRTARPFHRGPGRCPAPASPPDAFWRGSAAIFARFAPENRALLAKRDALQAKIDAWHDARTGPPSTRRPIRRSCARSAISSREPAPFAIATDNVDAEIARMAGPQLVVPVLNARFLLNAANARWGSLYDALYGTDALDAPPAAAPAATIRRAARR